tara:strand:+ start:388 stop:774 length:387 start_codon:yes stop_codon:yes gene_type:complete
MHYWQCVLREVLEYHKRDFKCIYTNLQEDEVFSEEYTGIDADKPKKRENKQYYLNGNFANIYLTQREAECMQLLMQGSTYKQAGTALDLSARTVEFYLKNIKKKMNLRKKSEVVSALENMAFWSNFTL